MLETITTIEDALPEHLQKILRDLTAAERSDIMAVSDPELREMMLSVRIPSPDITVAAKQQAMSFNAIVVAASDKEQLRLFSPYPTELTRCSPFFPLSTQEMANRPFLNDLVIADHSWGRVTFTGQKLSVYDEEMLMILLAAINERNHMRGEAGYTYIGSMTYLLKIKGTNNPGQNHREEAYASYKRMAGSTFEIDTSPTRSIKSTRGRKSAVNNIISNLEYDRKAGLVTATVNPYFYEMYCAGEVTWIDIEIRTSLKSPFSKALHRFCTSHQKDYWSGGLMILAVSLNLDPNLPKIKVRERLKKAISELISVGFLLSKSLIANDNVALYRSPKIMPKKQLGTK